MSRKSEGSPKTGDREVTVLELPYENRDVSLVILLPQRLDGLAALEKRVTAARLLHCVARLEERHNMTVYLPRLKLKSVTDLGPRAQGHGSGRALYRRGEPQVRVTTLGCKGGTLSRYLSKAEGAHLSGARHVAVLHANRKDNVDSDNDASPPPISRDVVSGTVTPPSASASCPTTTTPEGTLSPSSPSSPTADSSSGMNTSTALDEPSRSTSQFVVDRPFMLLMLKRRPDSRSPARQRQEARLVSHRPDGVRLRLTYFRVLLCTCRYGNGTKTYQYMYFTTSEVIMTEILIP
ncbi:hypothetical protein HPB51_029592 [Rhipicephalus microplus]|uniref:Serpin domain-containing protein n=1 Tax=Rhipicephalus microplus TaxID=6941 RepID=A0A9J6CTW3_RHIMP|nr:hypothetical protein HPB51_029592 [Rhipicephalus microplus]